jgi:hypothetical protein
MVLSEETNESVTFRFRGNRWALATLVPGASLVIVAGYLYFSGHPSNLLLGVLGTFGILLIYSTVYSATATQWLTVNGTQKSITFHKKNLYGLVHWEKQSDDFDKIEVRKNGRSSNWLITLVSADGYRIDIGENAFGASSQEKALYIANTVGSRTNIKIETLTQSY